MGVDGHLPVTDITSDLALNVGKQDGEDGVVADSSKSQDSSVHLLVVGGRQLGLQVRDVFVGNLGVLCSAHLAEHDHWEHRLLGVEAGPVEDCCKGKVSVVLQHLVGNNVGVLDQLKDLLDDVHVGSLDVMGKRTWKKGNNLPLTVWRCPGGTQAKCSSPWP